MTAPLVSVVVPMYNAAAHVQAALRSILQQRPRALEVVVVDDGSTDDSVVAARAIRDARVRVVKQSHAGPAAARNRGLAATTGELVAFLDADDEWAPGKLRRQIAALRSDAGLDMVFGAAVSVRDGRVVGTPVDGFCLGAMLVRADAIRRVGPFATAWQAGEFIDWFARAQDLGLRYGFVDRVVLRRRVHDANLTGNRGALTDYARVLRAVVERRRATGPLQ